MVLWGHHLPPVDVVARKIGAIRSWLNERKPEVRPNTETYAPYFTEQLSLIKMPVHADPVVQAYLDEYWRNTAYQAIGRLRSVWKPEPPTVIMATSTPALDLPVHKLTDYYTYCGLEKPQHKYIADVNKAKQLALDKRRPDLLSYVKPLYMTASLKHGRPLGRVKLTKLLRQHGINTSERDTRWLAEKLRNEYRNTAIG